MDKGYLTITNLVKKYGDVTAVNEISLSIEKGKLLSFLGPSGCGKTTTLRIVAGLETPTAGNVAVGGTVLSDEKHVVLPEKRNMSMVFQSYAVWPHMTVFDNVGYGLKIKKYAKSEILKRVREALELVGLGEYEKRFPTQLSGGQQQRVALARALVSEPDILLLDEPLCNLDAKLRENMRFEIRALQKRLGITTIYVTHSQDEALAVSDEIVIMRDGKILQKGSPEEIYAKPDSSFVADFIGVANKLEAKVTEAGKEKIWVRLANGEAVAVAADKKSWKEGEKAYLLIRPENLVFHGQEEERYSNSLSAVITNVSFTGNIVNYFIGLEGMEEGQCRVQSTPPVRFAAGDYVVCRFAPKDCVLVRE
ncbi:MAG: ABC transporter ATP-binding protein [Lachnospiraceae bacterium]|jgi:iron(III) transport system ATP-binding protein|nr:ABC transporter ATP-binding protein [Lachnospiraceae bacterium]